MVSEAELRRQRFLAAKEAAGGTDALINSNKNKLVRIFFDDAGTILCITTDADINVLPIWTKYHDFTQEQVSILKNKNHNLFYVKQDPLVDNLYSIENKPIESVYVTADSDFLSLVDYGNTYDIACSIKDSVFTIIMHKDQIDMYKNIHSNNRIAKGKKVLKFYITAKNDPHFLFDTVNVQLSQLVDKKTLDFKIKHAEDCSIYTIKLFDNYVRL